MMKKKLLLLAATVSIGLVGCGEPTLSNPQEKALIGAAGGALLGQAIGHDTKGTLIGAAAGALAGAAYGSYQDNNQRKYYKDQYGHTYYIDNNGQARYVD